MAEIRKFDLAMSPHFGSVQKTRRIMFDVVIALIPALIAAVLFFGPKVLILVALSVSSAIIAEFFSLKVMHRPVNMALDGSAVVTGILLAYNLPSSVPWWIPIIGSGFAIVVGKQAFGGLGHNIVNPALLGRAFLVASFPVLMTAGWVAPNQWQGGGSAQFSTSGIAIESLHELPDADAVSGATPLRALKDSFDRENGDRTRQVLSNKDTYMNLFLGRVGGCLGETSAILLLLGALYLIIRGVLELRLPLSYLGSVAFFAWIFGGSGFCEGDPVFHLLSGGVVLGGFFMVTDMVTTPVSPRGRIIFGFGAGLITMIIRRWGGYPEGCSYSILLMNLVTPLIDRFTRPRILGEVKKNG